MKKLGFIVAVVLVLASVLTLVAACDTKYDLSYASWDLGTETNPSIERKMVQKFEELYNVKIEIKEVPQGNAYEDSIRGYVVQDKAPDVFKINNTNFALSSGYALNIKDMANADADWQNIPSSIEEAVHFKNGIYAIPFSMHMQGYFINTTLLEEQGIRSIPSEISWEWLYNNVIKAMKGQTDDAGAPILGLSDEESILEWYPASANADYGYFTWDGSGYHLDSDEFIKGIELAAEIYNGHYSWNSLTEEEYEMFEGISSYVDLWNMGRLAVRWGYTYEMPNMLEENGGAFDIRFVGIPTVEGGREQNYVNLIGDYVSIYKGTKNAELAYQFAKWMSFDPDGIAMRIDLDKDEGVTNAIPLTQDASVLEKYFDAFDAVVGVEKMYNRLDISTLEPTKVFPGYQYARWSLSTGLSVTAADGTTIANANMGQFIDACRQGRFTYRDQAVTANRLANEQYAKAVSNYINNYE